MNPRLIAVAAGSATIAALIAAWIALPSSDGEAAAWELIAPALPVHRCVAPEAPAYAALDVHWVHATDEGRRLEKQVRPEVARAYSELQALMDPDEWEHLISGMERIVDACEQSENQPKAVNQ